MFLESDILFQVKKLECEDEHADRVLLGKKREREGKLFLIKTDGEFQHIHKREQDSGKRHKIMLEWCSN